MSRDNLSVVLHERPKAEIIPGQTFHQEVKPAPSPADLKDGEILVETLYLGLEPAMRGWLNDVRSYLPPVQLNAVMRGYSAARVLHSKSPKAKVGDYIHGGTGWQQYAILKEFDPMSSFPNLQHPKDMLAVLGFVGLTAWIGMVLVGDPKPGELVVVSAAAGATGSIAGQIAKLKGARVVGTAGSDEKCKWLKEELGFDEAINYKDPDFKEKFLKATGDLIDVYFDNVGGLTLDLALGQAKKDARFVMCGMISQYNNKEPYPLKNITRVVTMRIKMQGFIVIDHAHRFAEAREQLSGWVNEGKLKTTETTIKGGLKVAEQALVDLYKGVNQGKLIVEVKSSEESPSKL